MNLKDFNTLAEAQAHTAIRSAYITANTMNSILAEAGIYIAMTKIAATDGHFAQNAMAAFFDPRSTDYNFIVGDVTGDKQINLLDNLIAAGAALDTDVGGTIIPLATELATLRPMLIGLCNQSYAPFANETDHSFALAKDDQTRFKLVSNTAIVDNYLILEWQGTFDAHPPGVYEEKAGKKRRVTGFPVISGPGTYDAYVGSHRNLFVDDVYSAIV